MEDQELDARKIVGKVRNYVDLRRELAILSAVKKGSQLFANLLTDGLVMLFGVITILFGSLALGFYLSELTGNTYSGFFIVTGFYLLLAILLYTLKDKYMEKHIINAVIKKFFRDRKEDNNEK
jgi:hypothetical protein